MRRPHALPVRRLRTRCLLVALLLTLGSVLTATPAAAAQTIGFPTFSGPAIPAPPVAHTQGDMMKAIYDAESSGTDFWMDRLLARTGNDPAGPWLMSRGRALFMKTHNPAVLGFGGNVAYWEGINDNNAYSVAITPGTFTEQVAQRRQTPSHWKSVHTSGSVTVDQTKFITDNNVAVTNLSIRNNGSGSTTLQLRATSPYATTGTGSELTGQVNAYNNLTTLRPRLTGDGFTVSSGGLGRSVTIAAGATVTVKVVMGFVTDEIPESLTEYNAYAGYSPATAFATHVRAYNLWWAQNVPYIDVPEPAIKKNIYYRWWLMRFNSLDADIPGQTYQFPTSTEGVLGYNNAIALTQPMHIDDLKYLRNPIYAYGDWLSVGQISKGGRFLDNPGDPENWSNSYTQYIAEAAWKSYQIHGGQPGIAANLARYAEGDVKGQLAYYDHDNNKLIEYDWGALTGNDADAVSFHWKPGNMDRAESAYQYSGALAAAQAYEAIGNTAKATEMRTLANQIKDAIVNVLWNPNRQLFEHRLKSTGEWVPWKEINNYYPFSVGAVPNTATYRQALRLYDDPAQYPVFPFYTANQVDKKAAAEAGEPGSNNFSTINSTVQFRLYSSVLRDYPNSWMSATDYKKLLYWNTWAQYVGGNTQWPDANEFWADWNGSSIDYRSWIHHNILGSSNWTVIEDVAGLRPRNDAKVELSPIDIGWSHFTVNNLRYRGADLSIVWDDPADGVVRYPGVPEGYSIFVNGNRVATVGSLVPFTWDPATGEVTTSGTVTHHTAVPGLKAPNQVVQDSPRMVDMLAKAGIDLTADLTNLAAGATVSASHTGSGAAVSGAVDGYPTNEPFWGAGGSANSQDWYELNFGTTRTLNEVRLYFKDSRPASTTYRAPSAYTIQYWNGGSWVNAPDQTRSPAVPRANYNVVRFPAIDAQRVRVLATNASGAKTGLTEVKVYNRGGAQPPANQAGSATATASYTSPWETVTAVNDGIDPPSSNDTVNPRWGTWPESGQQWAELTWPSARTLNKAEVYFFDDDQGIDMPASWKLQYWNGSAYVDVPGASTYTLARNQYNSVAFTATSTTRLRVLLTGNGTNSVGLLEAKVYGP
ncbi:discoidin domain-containing protein [Streptomyces ipomoeae]|uniref:discoidin domain-containing protein n=1 Tax=Streptomyces ipomoeae TaxID=103232 RepID=UPI00114799A3|nr:discoidin domain-containing protein [Streptomyces ipomoeae]MDX2931631.1 discoidin domain-containing protein [Streptomyces ipomoeae]TQE30645.1 discoidin domain-containing protein [Streptomyces ipomoeae]